MKKKATAQFCTRLTPDGRNDEEARFELFAAHDLYSAALHEAGHCVTARHLTVGAEASIRAANFRPTAKRRMFVGQTYLGGPSYNGRNKAVIGVAGAVAQWLVDHRELPSFVDYPCLLSHMSPNDKMATGAHPFMDTAAAAVAILEQHLDNLQAVARKLIDDCVKEHARGFSRMEDLRRQGRDIKVARRWKLRPQELAALVNVVYADPDGSPRTNWPPMEMLVGKL